MLTKKCETLKSTRGLHSMITIMQKNHFHRFSL